jgi:hypothetical protein
MHTPAPWTVHNLTVTGPIGDRIANTNASTGKADAEKAANARLISAAPDLLEALKAMLAEFDNSSRQLDPELSVDIPRIAARAAVAKATA